MHELGTMLGWALEDGPLREELQAMGLAPTYENAIHLQMVKKAAAGDLSAAKYILDARPEETSELDLSEMSTEELKKMVRGDGLPRRASPSSQ